MAELAHMHNMVTRSLSMHVHLELVQVQWSGAQVAIYGMSAQKAFIISRKYGNPRCMIVAVLTIFIILSWRDIVIMSLFVCIVSLLPVKSVLYIYITMKIEGLF